MAELNVEISKALNDLIKGRSGGSTDIFTSETKALQSSLGKLVGTTDNTFNIFTKNFGKAFEGRPEAIGKILAGFEKLLSSVLSTLGISIKAAVNMFAEVLYKANQAWATAFDQGAAGVLTAFKNLATDLIPEGPIKNAIGSFLDNVIKSMMFRFEDGLRVREIGYAAQVQFGFGEAAAAKFTRSATDLFGPLGRDLAREWATTFVREGITNAESMKRAVAIGLATGESPASMAEKMKEYMAMGLGAGKAIETIEDNYRKLAKPATAAGLSVKMMSDYILQASKNARFLNVDIAQVGNMMTNLTKQADELSKFGVDFRLHGQTIANEFASGGKEISDAMHVWYGSKGGELAESPGTSWIRSMLGEKAAAGLTIKGEGGFAIEGGKEEIATGNTMMVQRLTMMKDLMIKAASSTSNINDNFLVQYKLARQQGYSQEAAVSLAKMSKDEIQKIADDPGKSAPFKKTEDILRDLQNMAAINEQIQRILAELNQKQLEAMLLAPEMTALAMKALGGDAAAQSKMGAIGTEQLKGLASTMGRLLAVMPFRGDPAYEAMKQLPKRFMDALLSMGIPITGVTSVEGLTDIGIIASGGVPTPRSARAGGGYTSGMTLVGEEGPELIDAGGSSYVYTAERTKDMLAANTRRGGGEGITLNVNISGVTKRQIMDVLAEEVDRAFS
ncbi:MAG TPA: hypothetical protein P5136_02310 [Methanofastidiosum sp.]|nr:hypothetical protein [Methanofastidiosum sp.]